MERTDLLKSLGLTGYEAEVYLALLRIGRARVQDLTKAVSVPRPHIYVALGGLTKRGIVTGEQGRVNYYSAVPPDIAFRDLLRREDESLKAKAEGIERLAEEFREIGQERTPHDFVQVLRGSQIRHVIETQFREAQREVLIFFKRHQYSSPKTHRDADRTEAATLKRGARVRCIYEERSLEDPGFASHVRQWPRKGEEARVNPSLPMNMVLFDDRMVTFSFLGSQSEVTVFASGNPALITMMREAFERYWERSSDLTQLLAAKKPKRTRPRQKVRKRRKKKEES